MLMRFGGEQGGMGVISRELILDVEDDVEGVYFRCLGGESTRGTIRQAEALVKALNSAIRRTRRFKKEVAAENKRSKAG